MADIGRKIYYDLVTGNVLANTGEMSGSVIGTTIERDFTLYTGLLDKNPQEVGLLQFEYGDLADEFRLCTGYSVDTVTGEMVFDMTPEQQEELEEIKTTAQQIAELQAAKIDNGQRIADIELALAELFTGGGV